MHSVVNLPELQVSAKPEKLVQNWKFLLFSIWSVLKVLLVNQMMVRYWQMIFHVALCFDLESWWTFFVYIFCVLFSTLFAFCVKYTKLVKFIQIRLNINWINYNFWDQIVIVCLTLQYIITAYLIAFAKVWYTILTQSSVLHVLGWHVVSVTRHWDMLIHFMILK